MKKLHEKCDNSAEHFIVDTVVYNCHAMQSDIATLRFNHGGIHNVVDFEFILHHGISAYRQKIEAALAQATDPNTRMFQEGMLDVLAGVEDLLSRYLSQMEQQLADDLREFL